MKTIDIYSLDRPRLSILPVAQADGSLVPGASYWSAILFSSKMSIGEVAGKHDAVRLQLDDEIWELQDATIMLNPDHGDDLERYIVTFSGIKRFADVE